MQATYTKEMLMPYRQQGYSNAEIAKTVGCAYNTVVRVLGHQDRELTILLQKQGIENYKAMERIKKEYREKREREAKEEEERLERERLERERKELARRIGEAKIINDRYLTLNRALKNYRSQANTYQKKIANAQKQLEQREQEFLKAKEQACRYIEMCQQELNGITSRKNAKEAVIKEESEIYEEARGLLESNGLIWKTAI